MDQKRKKPVRPKSDLTSRQMWILAMKEGKTGTGPSAQQQDSFTNLKLAGQKDIGYLSTSHYLRQVAGTEKSTPRPDSAGGARSSSIGRPNYKAAEEYYDEVIALKRELKAVREEMSSVKSKNRRLEEDYQKREKQLETLFDPTKNAELRRALADKNGETALVVQSLKQRIFKLEQQLRDKEATVSKLQSDVKVTKTSEMKTQLEVLYKEIVRLRSANPAEVLYSNESSGTQEQQEQAPKKAAQKLEALTAALRKVTDQKNVLTAENAQLKKQEAALNERLDELEGTALIPESYRDMNRNQLLSKIRLLEQENDRLKVAPVGNDDVTKNKISPTGNVREKLELLDRRETELLTELASMQDANKRLIEERDSYKLELQQAKKDADRLNFENSGLAKEVDRLRAAAGPGGVGAFRAASPGSGSRDRVSFDGDADGLDTAGSGRRASVRQEKPVANKRQSSGGRMKEDEALTKLQSVLRGHKARQDYLNREQQQQQPLYRRQVSKNSSFEDDSDSGEAAGGSFRARHREEPDEPESVPQRRPRPRSGRGAGGKDDEASVYSRKSSSSTAVSASTGKRSSLRQGKPYDSARHSLDDDNDVKYD